VAYLRVPAGSKRHPPYSPSEATRILFISVAPPWGGDYFWDETKPDKVRQGLFTALCRATGENFSSVSEFQSAGYFLVPGVKCPSEENNKDHLPHARAINHCSSHLVAEMRISRPERILALGQSETSHSIACRVTIVPSFPNWSEKSMCRILWVVLLAS
jgi:uracil-DNA glycosylase